MIEELGKDSEVASKLLDIVHLYKGKEYEMLITTCHRVQKNRGKDYVLKAIEFFSNPLRFKHHRKVDNAMYMTDEPIIFGKIIDVFDKYSDNRIDEVYEVLLQVSENNRVTETGLNDLLEDESYKAIKNHEAYILDFFYGFEMFKSKIKDEDFRDLLRVRELALIAKTYRLTLDIHHKRNPQHLMELEDGLYGEMNRSIAQGGDYYSKIRNLRRYCNEVMQQLKENAEELMLVK